MQKLILMPLLLLSLMPPFLQAKTAQVLIAEGKTKFETICTACHTLGRGRLVGPDLAGVTSRREESWLKRQIQEPDRMIAEKDPIVMALLKESNNTPMPRLGLSEEEVEAIIAYLKSTEQQASVKTGIPAQYLPTVVISLVVLLIFTWIGLRAGKKKIDVRRQQ